MNLQELIDSIYYDKSLNIKGEPLGKVNQVYPGATSEEEPYYVTHRSIDYYSSRLQQPIENKDLVKEAESDSSGGSNVGDITGGDEEEEFDTGEIGRIYELKKIFSRLISLETFLSSANEDVLIKLASYANDAINLFKLVIENIDQFIDDIDNIIISFYEFLDISYKLLKKHYDKLNQDEQGDN
ncbi:MAG: hypothetical protein K9L74_07735 [Candidatus Izimaplasma sp.]|nr:hypothetical protein [Candidatus Izimaplasma bacterium]